MATAPEYHSPRAQPARGLQCAGRTAASRGEAEEARGTGGDAVGCSSGTLHATLDRKSDHMICPGGAAALTCSERRASAKGGRVAEEGAEVPELNELVRRVSDATDADLYLFISDIDEHGFGALVETALTNKRRPNAILLLRTNGGLANSGYQIARFLQRVYGGFSVFPFRNCFSAGTLVCIGAEKIYMGPFSQLGPIDVQLMKFDEIGRRKSGLLPRATFEALSEASFDLFETILLGIVRRSGGLVSFRVAAEISGDLTSNTIGRVYEQVDPDVVGSDRRDLEVALHYGLRLAATSKNADWSSVYQLVHSYPSHDFIIDDEEARSLFENVDYPSSEMMTISALCEQAFSFGDRRTILCLNEFEARSGENEDDSDQEKGSASEGSNDDVADDGDEAATAGGLGSGGGDRGEGSSAIDAEGLRRRRRRASTSPSG
jgi:hypothetical protein